LKINQESSSLEKLGQGVLTPEATHIKNLKTFGQSTEKDFSKLKQLLKF